MKRTYPISFRCYYGKGNVTNHYQTMPLKDITRWLESYMFTHPNVESISVKIWPKDEEGKI